LELSLATADPLQRYRLLTSVIAPRPIAFVSTLDADGGGNLAPFSFFMMGGGNPPSLAFSPLHDRRRGAKDTLRNIEATGEFVVNVVTRAMSERVNQASFDYPPGVDEFDAAGFTREASALVRPPRVAESPAAMECKLFQVVRHGDGPQAGSYVIGEIVHVRVHDDALRADGLFDTAGQGLVARMGRDEWAELRPGEVFDLPRPSAG
jgi:flavin reductase (DIM6/NTAB) family NADH-FMN oxidoreductase RutF